MSAPFRLNLRERIANLSTRAKLGAVSTVAAVAAAGLTGGLIATEASGGPATPHPVPASATSTPTNTFEPSIRHAPPGESHPSLPAKHVAPTCSAVHVYKSTEMPFHDFSNLDSLANGDKVFRGHLFNPQERIIQHKATDGAAQPSEFDAALPKRAAALREALLKGDKDVVQLYTYLQPGYSGGEQMDVLLGQLVKLKLATAEAGGKVKLLPGIQLMLDYEQPGLHPSVVKEASARAHARAGQYPVIYASSSRLKPLADANPHDSVIVANYNGTAANPGKDVLAFAKHGKVMFQWYGGQDTGENLDRDVSRGTTQNELRASVGEKKVC